MASLSRTAPPGRQHALARQWLPAVVRPQSGMIIGMYQPHKCAARLVPPPCATALCHRLVPPPCATA
eukprot:3395732-Pleurochrysis_carterae.AAC.1